MKRILNAIWQFLQVLGEHRYQWAKRRGYGMYCNNCGTNDFASLARARLGSSSVNPAHI